MMIKEFIDSGMCRSLRYNFRRRGKCSQKKKAASGLVLVLCALVLSTFSVVYTVHCAWIIRGPTFASEYDAFKELFPKTYFIRVHFLLVFTRPISIVFALYAAYVLWDCYRNKLYFGIPPDDNA
ncbi:hypothetical protein RF11_08703 [Thelohanellus kitauei]|uniref:Uncharacterized protein n=1 Tax=Thelohanellus kitauei TaxID=669202 RepID=A0A0C2N3X9_THEKT|nr:hypothetical protein RF11_08703 [Thelohanellus kitauei]